MAFMNSEATLLCLRERQHPTGPTTKQFEIRLRGQPHYLKAESGWLYLKQDLKVHLY